MLEKTLRTACIAMTSFALLGAASGCESSTEKGASSAKGDGEGGRGAKTGSKLPPLTLNDLKGSGSISLRSLEGKVVLLDIWASWCAPCQEEMPMLDDMAARLKSKGVEIVAVSIDEDKAQATEFLKRKSKWNLRLAHDPDGKVAGVLKPPKMPTSYVIDRDGVLRHVNAGFERSDVARIEASLNELASSD